MPRHKPSLESCLGSPISFYDGEVKLRFAKDPYHEYYLVCGDSLERVDGVTHACGILDKSMFLIPWACKMMEQKLLRSMPRVEDELGIQYCDSIAWKIFEELVKDAKKAHREKLADASDVGAAAHEWLDKSIKESLPTESGIVRELSEQEPADERAKNCGLAAFDWMNKHGVIWMRSEEVVYSRKWKYAGTMDGLAMVNSCGNAACCPESYKNRICVIDWKSSNALRTEYLYQTAAYQNAHQEEFVTPIFARWILRLGKDDGKFESWFTKDFEKHFEVFTNLLTLQRNHMAVEERIKGLTK
jgi:hypothetical protein